MAIAAIVKHRQPCPHWISVDLSTRTSGILTSAEANGRSAVTSRGRILQTGRPAKNVFIVMESNCREAIRRHVRGAKVAVDFACITFPLLENQSLPIATLLSTGSCPASECSFRVGLFYCAHSW